MNRVKGRARNIPNILALRPEPFVNRSTPFYSLQQAVSSTMDPIKNYTAAEHKLTQILLTELLAYVAPSQATNLKSPILEI